MCRHLAYLGPPTTLWRLVVAPRHGLYEHSWAPRQVHGVVNADGFGLGWYPAGEQDEPARYRRALPIWADPNVPELTRAIRTHAVLAAVRSATPGTSQDEAAVAPFRDGRFLFSHNGIIADWEHLPAELGASGLDAAALLALDARSDSALLWALIRARLRRREPPDEAVVAVLGAVEAARPGARLTVLLTDGRTIVAVRHGDSLWYRTGRDHVVIASEPDDEEDTSDDWHEVPDHSLMLATQAGVCEAVKLSKE
jgi:ergothioneine biosynthesis protein EgtC